MMNNRRNPFSDIQAIAFDLDGTLVDSAPGLTLAIQKMLADLKLQTITEQQVKTWVGNGIQVLIERVFSSIHFHPSSEQFSQAIGLFNHYYDDLLEQGTQLFPDVKDTLTILHDNHYPMALVTNKPAQFLPELLNGLGIKHYFSVILGGGDVIKLKPHPAPLYQVLASLGLFSQQLLFVGDSKNDILAAKNAYCPTVGLTYGYNYGESITTSQPDIVFDRFKDILTILPLPKTETN